jgi:hypothetical protein
MHTSDVETFLLENGRSVSARRKNVFTIASNTAVELVRDEGSALTRKLRNRSRRLHRCEFSALLSLPQI